MEYDNDRIRKRPPKMEVFYWILLVLFNPLTNSFTVFPYHPAMWPVLLLINLLLLPAYIIYSRIIGQTLFTQPAPLSLQTPPRSSETQPRPYQSQLPPQSRWGFKHSRALFAILLSILSFLVIQAFLLAVYSLMTKFPLLPVEKTYFTFNAATIARESWWTIVNMALAIALFYLRKADDEKDLISLMHKENIYYQLRYLRSQLNPHFLFNTLNSIYSLCLQKSDKAPEVVVRLADIMRYLIYECNEEKILLDKEIEFIRNYIEIEKMRHKADIRFTVEGLTHNLQIEPYLFISFIENGFKHAMDHSFGEPFIYITLKVGNGQLTLNVINSTDAELEMQAKRVNGMGLSHSRSLLELLYPSSYDLDIIQTEMFSAKKLKKNNFLAPNQNVGASGFEAGSTHWTSSNKDESRTSELRLRNARERLEELYPDSHTLDVILSKSSFTVSLILKTVSA
ncbi:MAG: sensor histidine kinase [Bacteroidetes bacterium]|nr:sensor histidine kinase [Bacteroidota bacterium]